MEEIKKRFDKKFKGQTELSQSILSALEYRGFYDSGKYLDDDISERIAPIILAFIQSEIDLAVSKELENERQFILNVLDGVDEADRQMGNIEGGTLAIRHALKSRTICK